MALTLSRYSPLKKCHVNIKKCHVNIIMIKICLSGFVITMHLGFCKQFVQHKPIAHRIGAPIHMHLYAFWQQTHPELVLILLNNTIPADAQASTKHHKMFINQLWYFYMSFYCFLWDETQIFCPQLCCGKGTSHTLRIFGFSLCRLIWSWAGLCMHDESQLTIRTIL